MNTGCGHSKIGPQGATGAGRHCAYMECQNYISSCPLHAAAQTGMVCNLMRLTSLWLVEEVSLGLGSVIGIIFHAAVPATTPQEAFDKAEKLKKESKPKNSGSVVFLYSSTELEEVEPGYMWEAADGSSVAVQVRKVTLS